MKGYIYVGDTETTGHEPADGDRMLEICFIELDSNRKRTGREFHEFVDPEREVPLGAFNVHGISREDAIEHGKGQKFKDVAQRLVDFLQDGTVVTHNVAFDKKFLNAELVSCGKPTIDDIATTFCTLEFARAKHPGQRNSLDALIKRYSIITENRDLHGAKLDTDILIDVYKSLTLEQKTLKFSDHVKSQDVAKLAEYLPRVVDLPVYEIPEPIESNHAKMIAKIDKYSGGNNLWR